MKEGRGEGRRRKGRKTKGEEKRKDGRTKVT